MCSPTLLIDFPQVANFDYIDEEAAATAAAAAEEAEREARAKLEAEMEGQGQGRAQFWDTLLKDRVEEAQVEEIEELGKGKRSRRTVIIISFCPYSLYFAYLFTDLRTYLFVTAETWIVLRRK